MIHKFRLYSILAVCLTLLSGCFGNLNYKLYDEYSTVQPKVLYLAPIEWRAGETDSKDVAIEFLDSLIKEKLKTLGYKATDSMELSDAYLETTVTHWKEKLFPTYGALKIGFKFQIITTGEVSSEVSDSSDSKDLPVIWKAAFTSKDYDLKFDTSQMEMGIIKAFEPRLERAVDSSFSTLPEVQFIKEEETFFDWLP